MLERDIDMDDVREVLQQGEAIASYPDDVPYPTRLLLGWSRGRALHVLVANDVANDAAIVVTTYEPDPESWNDGFRRRRGR